MSESSISAGNVVPVGMEMTAKDLQEYIGCDDALVFSSAHHIRGGLFAFHDRDLIRLDNVPSTGLAYNGRTLARGLVSQPDATDNRAEVAWFDSEGLVRMERLDGLGELHDLIVDPHDNEALLIVSSATNDVVRHRRCRDIRKVVHPGSTTDSSHRNCLTTHRGLTYMTAFSLTFNRREWDTTENLNAGVLIELESGRVVVEDLCRPHSPLRSIADDGWFLVNSGVGQLLWCGDNGERIALELGDWPQDIVRLGEHLLVAVSNLRGRATDPEAGSELKARLVLVRERDLTIVGTFTAPCPPIYDQEVVPKDLVGGLRIGFNSNQIRYVPRSPEIGHSTMTIDEALPESERRVRLVIDSSTPCITTGADILVSGAVYYLGSEPRSTVGKLPVSLGWRWSNGTGEGRHRFPAVLVPQRRTNFEVVVPGPLEPGEHEFQVGVVQEHVAWFEQTAELSVTVMSKPTSEPTCSTSEPSLKLSGQRRTEKLRAVKEVRSWWHSINLGDGVVTPGHKSAEMLDDQWRVFQLGSLVEKTVLDIGAWDGYFSFAAERAGAERVLAIDDFAWSVDWVKFRDRVTELKSRGEARIRMRDHSDLWDIENLPGKAGFDVCHHHLDSRVDSTVANYLDVESEALGLFDVVLYLGVLHHETNPLLALEKVRSFTKTVAVIETNALFFPGHDEVPTARFYPDNEMGDDYSTWWMPNEAAVRAMTSVVGFSRIEIMQGHPIEWDTLSAGSPVKMYQLTAKCYVN